MTSSTSLFSDREFLIRQKEIAKRLTSLKPQQADVMSKIADFIMSSPANREAYSEAMVDPEHEWYLFPDTLFRLYMNESYAGHTTFKNFLNDSSLPHAKVWARELKSDNFFDFDIESVDKDESETLTIAKERIIAYLVTRIDEAAESKEPPPKEELDYLASLACELGSVTMLLRRCDECVAKLKKSTDDILAIGMFFNSIAKLANLYGSFGYFKAACYLLDLVHHHENNHQTDAENHLTLTAYMRAAECFFRAQVLYEDTANRNDRKVLNQLTGGKGLKFFLVEGSALYIPESELISSKESEDERIYKEIYDVFLKRLDANVLSAQKLQAKSSKRIDLSLGL